MKERGLRFPVNKRYLYVVSGLIWMVMGIVLINIARNWLLHYEGERGWIFSLSGFLLALASHYFGLLKVVNRNLGRIDSMVEKPSIFAVMSIRGYLLILLMMAIGIVLRKSPIPHEYLAIIYIGMGFGLSLSSIRYFRVYIRSSCRNEI